MKQIRQSIYLFLGSISLAIGITGAFIPILPTTPFLLLAAFCYLRSSKRMYNWLIHHKVFGAYLYGYMTYKAIPRKTKIITAGFLWSTLIVSMILIPSLPIRLLLLVVGIGVTVHLMVMKTMSLDDMVLLRKRCNRE